MWLANFSLGSRDKLKEVELLFGRPNAFNPALKVLNRLLLKTGALSNTDFASLKIERLAPSPIACLYRHHYPAPSPIFQPFLAAVDVS
jgi:hypothetical protein